MPLPSSSSSAFIRQPSVRHHHYHRKRWRNRPKRSSSFQSSFLLFGCRDTSTSPSSPPLFPSRRAHRRQLVPGCGGRDDGRHIASPLQSPPPYHHHHQQKDDDDDSSSLSETLVVVTSSLHRQQQTLVDEKMASTTTTRRVGGGWSSAFLPKKRAAAVWAGALMAAVVALCRSPWGLVPQQQRSGLGGDGRSDGGEASSSSLGLTATTTSAAAAVGGGGVTSPFTSSFFLLTSAEVVVSKAKEGDDEEGAAKEEHEKGDAASDDKKKEEGEGGDAVGDEEDNKKAKKNDEDEEEDDGPDDDDRAGSAIPSMDELAGYDMDGSKGAGGTKAPTLPVEENEPTDDMSEEQQETVKAGKEKHGFHAEVHRLMDIIINSLYSQKEVFLRELVSNAADALEKIRILSLKDSTTLGDVTNLDIRIDFNKNAKTLSITDTGIGMTKADLINNLGTVAKSGTTNFLEAIAQGGAADANLIGQFGVGFYSVFLVADRVAVTSKHNDDEQYIWESSADAFFSIVKDPRGNTLGRGTRITLFMKEDATSFLNEFQITDLLNRYSRFISFPIYLKKEKTVTVEEEDEEEGEEGKKKKDAEEEDKEDGEKKDGDDVDVKDEEEKPKKKKVDKKVKEYEQVNLHKAIWMRPKEEVTEEEYAEFYKAVSKDYAKPLTYIHFSAEGEIEFKALIYIPEHAPRDMFNNYFQKQTTIKLYVRRVLVADKFDDLMPKYLHFVTGVVDSDDLPLNVSREHLQQHKLVKVISKKLVRKTLELMKKLMKDAEKEKKELSEKVEKETDDVKKEELQRKLDDEGPYDKFYTQYSRNLKLGCYEDAANRTKLLKLLKFVTNKSNGKKISLDQYVEKMGEKQKAIYYASGESVDQLAQLPQLQAYAKLDLEVLFLTESMDEPCLSNATDFDGKKFESIQKGDMSVDMTDDEKKREKRMKKMYEPLLKWWRDQLTSKVMKVELSRRLVDAPCGVTASQFGYSAYMEKMMKSQTFADQGQFAMMKGQKTLEVNPNHSIVKDLLRRVNANPADEQAKKTAMALFDTALLASGFDVSEPQELARRLYKGAALDLGLSPAMPVEEVELPEEEPEEKKVDGDEEAGDEEAVDDDKDSDDEDDDMDEKAAGEKTDDDADGKKKKKEKKGGEKTDDEEGDKKKKGGEKTDDDEEGDKKKKGDEKTDDDEEDGKKKDDGDDKVVDDEKDEL